MHSATACVERFMATFFVARLESALLTTVFDALVLYHNRDVPVPFRVLGLWELHGSSLCASESQTSVVLRTGAVATWWGIATGTPMVLSMYWICGNFKVFCASESHAPVFHHNAHFHTLLHDDNSTIFWISWMVGTVSAQRGGSQQQSSGSS